MKQDDQLQRSRLPKGMPDVNPVAMRLSGDERDALKVLAGKECRSISSMARLVFLRGMEAVNAK